MKFKVGDVIATILDIKGLEGLDAKVTDFHEVYYLVEKITPEDEPFAYHARNVQTGEMKNLNGKFFWYAYRRAMLIEITDEI